LSKCFILLVCSNQMDSIAMTSSHSDPHSNNIWKLLRIEFSNMFGTSGSLDLAKFQNKIIAHSNKFLIDIILYCLFDQCSCPIGNKSFSCSAHFSFKNIKYKLSKKGKNGKTISATLAIWDGTRWIDKEVDLSIILFMVSLLLGDCGGFKSTSVSQREQLDKAKDPTGLRRMEDPVGLRQMEDPVGLRRMEDPVGLRQMEDPVGLRQMEDPVGLRQMEDQYNFLSRTFGLDRDNLFEFEIGNPIVPKGNVNISELVKGVPTLEDKIKNLKGGEALIKAMEIVGHSKSKKGEDTSNPKPKPHPNKVLMKKMPKVIATANEFLNLFSDYQLECYFVRKGKPKEKQFDPEMSPKELEQLRKVEIKLKRTSLPIEFDIDVLDNCEHIIADIALAIGFKEVLNSYTSNVLVIESNFGYEEIDNIDRVKGAIRCARAHYETIIIVSDSEDIKELTGY
jgi:hypothetical protein